MRNLQKFLRIKKYGLGDPIQLNFTPMSQLELKKDMGTLTGNDFQQAMNRMKNMEFQSTKDYIQQQQEEKDPLSLTNMSNTVKADMESKGMATSIQDPNQSNTNNQNGPSKDDIMGNIASSLGVNSDFIGSEKGQVSAGKAMGIGIAATAGVDALKAIDNMAMGDKNFGAQSAAIDSAVHGVSQALIKSGNPYAMASGAALEAANFLTKAGGQTTEGFDVDIKSSGYGNIGHKESSSSRDFGAMIGLGGLNQGKMDRKLAKRNEEAQMALKAANVADTIKFEQEARMNSVQDVIQQNEIALSGGIDSSLLAAKKGGKLKMSNKLKVIGRAKGGILIVEEEPIKQEKECKLDTSKPWIEEPPIENNITKAKFGAKLEQIDVSDTPSVIPSGALHKNKHNDFDLENITKKGIPVVTVEDDTVTTLPEIQAQENSIVQHAEVEKEEIIFNKDLTDYIEELRAKWHNSNEQDDSILLEAGMRLAKELIENTEDNTNVTEKAQTQI